jgi:endonuclease/exonuclease/phosphatase family metal-dependent hydrolase
MSYRWSSVAWTRCEWCPSARDAARVRSTLQAVRPDIAGLQEVWATAETTQAHQLADQLGMHCAFGAPSLPPPPWPPERPDQAGVDVGVAVLSRWPIRDVQQHRLASQHRPDVVALAVVVCRCS